MSPGVARADGTQIGTGQNPAIAVDGSGMTHVVWNEAKPGGTDVLHYCRIPEGATACGDQQTFEPFSMDGNYDVAGPQVLITSSGDVILLTNRVGVVNGQFAANQIYYSSNHGAPGSFDGPTAVSSNSPSGRPAVFDSGEGLLVTVSASRTGGTFVQGAPIESGFTTSEAQLSSGSKAYDGTVIQRGPGSYAAAYSDFDNVYVRTFQCTGAGCARQKLNDPTNWTAEVTVPEAQEPRLASGPSGTFLMYRTHPSGGGPSQWAVRPIVGAGVGAPTPISALGAGGVHRDLFVDTTGVLHAVFKDENAALVYRSSPDGTAWSAPTTLQPGPDFAVGLPRVGATNGPSGLTGFAVWVEGSGNAPILIARLAPSGSPPPPTGPPNNIGPPRILPTATADTYMCLEGTWGNLPPDPKYEYFWLYSPTGGAGASYDVVGNARTFAVTPDRAGGSFYCAVRITNDLGTGAAHSDVMVLGTRRFGDFQIRGIDLFQTVQPSSCGRMYSVPPAPWGQDTNFGERLPSDPFIPLNGYWFAGGGTPTAYGATRIGCVEQGLVGSNPQRVPYAGVTLDADKPTTAVVYVSMANKGAGFAAKQQLEVTLSFLIHGKRFASITQNMTNPPNARRPFVTAAERDAPGSGGVQFSVPDFVMSAARESNDLSVEASVDFPAVAKATGARQCDGPGSCDGNDRFRLDNVPVRGLPTLLVESVALFGRPPATRPNQNLPDPARVLEKARQLYPGGDRMYVTDYAASLDVGFEMNLSLADHECTDFSFKDARACREYYVGQALVRWSIENGRPAGTAFDVLLGVHDYRSDNGGPIEPGYTLSSQRAALNGYIPGQGGQPIFTANGGSANRPVTAAAHEFGHVLSAPHAGQDCNETRPGDPQEGEPWPPDNQGRLWGAKFDRTAGGDNVTVDKSDGFLSDGFDFGPTVLHDLMSYCASEGDAWLSPRNWNRAFEVLREFGKRPGRHLNSPKRRRLAASAAKRAVVVGIIGPNGSGRIVRLSPPDASNAAVTAAPNSAIRLRALDASGHLIEESGALLIHPTSSQEAGGTFVGTVPGGAAAVQLISDGKVVDTRARSRAPKVRVLAPRRGAFVRARKKLLVRWTASDPDKERLQAVVEYSSDGGRHWATVFDGPSAGRASVPGRILAGSKRARIRVRVSDGYDEARAVSGIFRSEGRPPKPTIVRPVTGEKVQAGDRTILVGAALDDRNQPLRGSSLTWFAGRKRLGSGNRRTVRLDAGRVKLRLVARDAGGRQGVATRTIRVAPVALRITTLRLPASVKHRAKTVKIRIAASGAAALRAGGGRFKVGTRARSLAIRLPRKPASGKLRLPIDLRAGGRVVRGRVRATLTVVRA